MASNDLTCSRWRWLRLVTDLRQRGGGASESGAFLLAPPKSRRISRYALFDDLEPGCLHGGYITFTGRGYVALSQLCEEHHLKVVADVHTHPGAWVGQSPTDQEHPMMSRPGHIALILPRLARGNSFSTRGIGIHLLRAPGDWVSGGTAVRLSLL